MAARIHFRPLVDADRTKPALLLTADTEEVSAWLDRLHLRKGDATAIEHGWILTGPAALRVRAAIIADGHKQCAKCSGEVWCKWTMEHADALEHRPFAIPFTRGGALGYFGGDDALIDLGLAPVTVKDAARSVGKQLRSRAEELVRDPAMQQMAEDFLREQAKRIFGNLFGKPGARMGDARAEAERMLGLSGAYTADDVKRAKRAAAMEHHPDRGGDGATAARMNAAADLLAELLR